MGGERILIIDNKTETNSFLTGVLEPLGYQLKTVRSGRAGLEMALAEPPDLLLLNLNVEGVPGIDVLEALHRHDFACPVILMAYPGSEETLVRALRLGVRDYILEPIEINELIVSIDWALAEGRLRREREQLVSELQVALADYAATALCNSCLYEEARQRAGQLAAVNRVAQAVASSLDLDTVIAAVLHEARQCVRAESALLALHDEKAGDLALAAVLDGKGGEVSRLRLPTGQGVVGWVVEHGLPARTDDVARDPLLDRIDHVTGLHTRSLLCVPVTLPGRILGAIEVVNKLDTGTPAGCHAFTPEDQELLQDVAAFVALAIENARLHAAVRETVAAETLHEAVVTLSHHVNNPLQALMGAAERLRCEAEDWAAQTLAGQVPAAHIADLIEEKVLEISVVLSVLEGLSVLELKSYLGTEQMLNIEQELRRRMAADSRGRKRFR